MKELKQATKRLEKLIDKKYKFINSQDPDGLGEPACGYPHFDETVTDWNYDIAEAAEALAAIVRRLIERGEIKIT